MENFSDLYYITKRDGNSITGQKVMNIKKKELRNEICEFLKPIIENISDGYGNNTYVKTKLSDMVSFNERNSRYEKFEKRYNTTNTLQNIWVRNRIIKIFAWHYKFNNSISNELKEWLDNIIKHMYKVNGKKINFIKRKEELSK